MPSGTGQRKEATQLPDGCAGSILPNGQWRCNWDRERYDMSKIFSLAGAAIVGAAMLVPPCLPRGRPKPSPDEGGPANARH
jgi:hypothetical protein